MIIHSMEQLDVMKKYKDSFGFNIVIYFLIYLSFFFA